MKTMFPTSYHNWRKARMLDAIVVLPASYPNRAEKRRLVKAERQRRVKAAR